MNRSQRRRAARTPRQAPAEAAAATLAAAARLLQTGNAAAAAESLERIVERHPDHAEALHLLGIASYRLGQKQAGLAHLARSLDLAGDKAGDRAGFHYNYGQILQAEGQLDEAAASYRRSLEAEPGNMAARTRLGRALKELGEIDEAIDCFRRVVAARPDAAAAHSNLGNVLRTAGHLDEAGDCYRRALDIDPGFAEAHNNLGILHRNRGEFEAAAGCFHRAIELKPRFVEAHHNLGTALASQGMREAAEDAFRAALAIAPDFAGANNDLGQVLVSQGRVDEAVAAFRRAIGIRPGDHAAHSNLLFALHYSPAHSAETLYAEAQAWNRAHGAAPGGAPPHGNIPDPGRRLRVGYVSPDFCEHAVSHYFEPLLAAHDRNAVEVLCYAEVARPDATSDRLRGLADGWLAIAGMSDDAVADRIRADGVDILVDLAGHTARNRLAVFARKPAPVQVSSYLGYPATTGLGAMDYRLTDPLADPLADPPGEADAYYSETLVRLPRGFHCYRPPDAAPAVAALPAAAAGYVTFGSFNNLAKVTSEVVAVWAEILRRRPDARLLLKSAALGEAGVQRRYAALFAGHGVTRERVEMVGPLASVADHMALYGSMDIGLDPFPYNGMTTTCEALWMGVPVVALTGRRHVARVGTSLLDTVGLPDLAADTVEGYVERAVALAGDIDNLAALRAGLRQRVSASALGDAAGFARHVEDAYRGMWRKWCAGKGAPRS